MDILYRQAVPADAERLLAYLKLVGGESDNLSFGPQGVPLTVEQEAQILANSQENPRSTMLLALDGDEIVGIGSIDCPRSARFAHRRGLALSVRKPWWGRGIGSALMERLISFARESGAEIVSLEVRSDNERAKALYRKFGFVPFGTYRKFFKLGGAYFDADYMNLYL